MRIAVNTRLLLKDKLEGIGWFTFETLKRITRAHKEHEFIFIFDRKFDPEFIFSDNIIPQVLYPQARHPYLYYLWFEFSIPYILKKYNADLFLSPDGYLSLSSNIKSVAVFHDISFEHYPSDIPPRALRYYKYYFPKFAAKAKRIATVSEYSKQDIVQQYSIDPSKIDVVYNGANENYFPLEEKIILHTKQEITGGSDYFVYIGAIHQRKNIANLLRAFDLFKESDIKNMKLVLVGKKMWWTESLQSAYESMKYREDVIFTGRLETEKLHRVLGSAIALTYISYFEGFGIPLVEAFYSNVPVITSNVTSLPEVAGDAALLVDPFSIPSISEAMQQISSDKKLREELILKGSIRRKLVGIKLLKTYGNVLKMFFNQYRNFSIFLKFNH